MLIATFGFCRPPLWPKMARIEFCNAFEFVGVFVHFVNDSEIIKYEV